MGHTRFFTAWTAVPVVDVAVCSEGACTAGDTTIDDAGVYMVSHARARLFTPLSIRSKTKGKNTKGSEFPLVKMTELIQEKTTI
jgi:hypothetical protein